MGRQRQTCSDAAGMDGVRGCDSTQEQTEFAKGGPEPPSLRDEQGSPSTDEEEILCESVEPSQA